MVLVNMYQAIVSVLLIISLLFAERRFSKFFNLGLLGLPFQSDISLGALGIAKSRLFHGVLDDILCVHPPGKLVLF